MNVSELIKELQKLPPQWDVMATGPRGEILGAATTVADGMVCVHTADTVLVTEEISQRFGL